MLQKSDSENNSTDKELVDLYRDSGDLEVLGTLFNRYMPLVYGVSLKYLINSDDSQDAVMQIFEKLIVKLKEHEVDNFKSWLHVLTKNHCLMWIRRTKSKEVKITDLETINMENQFFLHHEGDNELEEDLSKLETCIQKLIGEQKECVQLFYLQRKCYREIEQITKHELKKIKSYIQNGKRNLKICMEGNE